jgi:hypothetical protein
MAAVILYINIVWLYVSLYSIIINTLQKQEDTNDNHETIMVKVVILILIFTYFDHVLSYVGATECKRQKEALVCPLCRNVWAIKTKNVEKTEKRFV